MQQLPELVGASQACLGAAVVGARHGNAERQVDVFERVFAEREPEPTDGPFAAARSAAGTVFRDPHGSVGLRYPHPDESKA